MQISLNVIVDLLNSYPLEIHVADPGAAVFSWAALLPRHVDLIRDDLIHVCRLSDALRVSSQRPGAYYICVRDRIADAAETPEAVNGMVIVNENVDIEILLNKIQEHFTNIAEWYRKMQEALLEEKDLQEILNLCDDIIGNSINISDSAFSLLARTNNIETDDPLCLALAENGEHPYETLMKFRQSHMLEVWEKSEDELIVDDSKKLGNYVMVSKVYRFRDTYFAHVVMTCDHKPMTPGLVELFKLLTDILAFYAERNWKDKNALSHNYDAFLVDLIEDKITDPEMVQSRAKYLNIDADACYCVARVSVEAGMQSSLGRIGHDMTYVFPDSKVVIYNQSLVTLIKIRVKEDNIRLVPREQLEAFANKYYALVGLSNTFFGLEHLHDAFKQADLALKYHKRIITGWKDELNKDENDSPVCAFAERVLHILIGQNPFNDKIWRDSVYFKALVLLKRYDTAHKTNNLQLLRTYLWYERKATETASVVHMHRNNVLYRIGRIEKLIGLSLDDYPTRLALEISFLLIELNGLEEPADEDILEGYGDITIEE